MILDENYTIHGLDGWTQTWQCEWFQTHRVVTVVPYETFFLDSLPFHRNTCPQLPQPRFWLDHLFSFLFPFAQGKHELDAVFFSPLVLFSNSCFFGVCLAGDFIVLEFSCFPLWFLLWRFKHVENICWRALVNKRVDETFCEKIVAEACLRNKFNRSLLFKYNPESPRSTFEEMCLV